MGSDQTPYKDIPEATIMTYFGDVIDAMFPKIVKDFNTCINDCPNCDIFFTGHSLGGSLATLMTGEFLNEPNLIVNKNKLNLYTFGAPRTGNLR
eukprot:UN24512